MRHNTKSNIISYPDGSGDRLVLSGRELGAPGLLMLGRLRYPRAHKPLPEHRHPQAVEICYLAKGRQHYAVGKREYHLTGGDVFLTFPGESHGSGRSPEEKSILYWLIVRVEGEEPLLSLTRSESREMRQRIGSLRVRHFKGHPRMHAILEDILAAGVSSDTLFRTSYINGKLVEWLKLLIECAEKRPAADPAGDLAPVLRHIDEKLAEKTPVRQLAALAGLSASRFKAKFKKATGVPPAEYVLRKKIEKAREWLERGGKRITEVAFDLDFSSSQYFATVFKRYTGQNPRVFLKRKGVHP